MVKQRILFLVGILVYTMGYGTTSAFSSDGDEFHVKWKNGLRYETEDKSVKLKFGGRIMNDWVTWTSADKELEEAVGKLEDGTEFRRARLYVAGTIHDKLEFKAQYDFAGGDANFKDVYIGLKKLPFGNVRVGHFREPLGLEELISSKYITLMERSLVSAFVPSRNTGLMFYDAVFDKRATWAVGAFRETDGFGEDSGDDNGYNYTGRITALPWWDDDGASLLHIGASYSFKNSDGNVGRFRQRPEVHISPRFVDTGEFESDSVSIVGAELAFILHALSIQTEYVQAFVNSDSGEDPNFPSFYVMASYFLTGEHRPYKKKSGAFGRVTPNESYVSSEPGIGAWELAARYSFIDLDDGSIAGGELNDVTVGVNWYMHPNARVMLNWVYADLDQVGKSNAIQSRFQIDF